MTRQPRIRIAHVRDPLGPAGEARILVDRLWPRGIAKAALGLDEWNRDVAPTSALRKWFGHDPDRWDEFRARYCAELEAKPDAVGRVQAWCHRGPVALLFAARDRERNNAAVLRDYLRERLAGEAEASAAPGRAGVRA